MVKAIDKKLSEYNTEFFVDFFAGIYLTMNVMCLINALDVYNHGFGSHKYIIISGDFVSIGLVFLMPFNALIIVCFISCRRKPDSSDVRRIIDLHNQEMLE
jgi:hypothetical protein